jgi:predicted RNA-binding Zn-ribbon protein involved in translation (DUF1610 family)
MTEVVPFNRTLEQELLALSRGVSLECLVCGEFVLRRGGELACPECGSVLRADGGAGATQLEFDVQAG